MSHEIDIKEAIGLYEFTVVPRSMFSPDGTMLRCSAKSALMSILEKLPPTCTSSCETTSPTTDNFTVHIIDGMAVVSRQTRLDQELRPIGRSFYRNNRAEVWKKRRFA